MKKAAYLVAALTLSLSSSHSFAGSNEVRPISVNSLEAPHSDIATILNSWGTIYGADPTNSHADAVVDQIANTLEPLDLTNPDLALPAVALVGPQRDAHEVIRPLVARHAAFAILIYPEHVDRDVLVEKLGESAVNHAFNLGNTAASTITEFRRMNGTYHDVAGPFLDRLFYGRKLGDSPAAPEPAELESVSPLGEIRLTTHDGLGITAHEGVDGFRVPAIRTNVLRGLGNTDHSQEQREGFWNQFHPLLAARLAQDAPVNGERVSVGAESIVPWTHEFLGRVVKDDNIPASVIGEARQLLAHIEANYELPRANARPTPEDLANIDFTDGRAEVQSLNALSDQLTEHPIAFAEMVKQGLVVVDKSPVYRRVDDGQQGQLMPYMKIMLPGARTGMYVPNNLPTLNPDAFRAGYVDPANPSAKPLNEKEIPGKLVEAAKTINSLAGVVEFAPGIGSSYAEARTNFNPGLTFYKGVDVTDNGGETKKVSLFPYLVDITLNGLGDQAPRYFGSHEGTTAVARFATIVAKAIFIEAKADALRVSAEAAGKKEANSRIQTEAEAYALPLAGPRPADSDKKAFKEWNGRYNQELNKKKQELSADQPRKAEFITAALKAVQSEINTLSPESVPAFYIGRSQGGLIGLQAGTDLDERTGFKGVVAINPSNTSQAIVDETNDPEREANLTGGLNPYTWGVYLRYTPSYPVMRAVSRVASLLLMTPGDMQYPQGYVASDVNRENYRPELHQFERWQDYVLAQPELREMIAHHDPPPESRHNLLMRDSKFEGFYTLVTENVAQFFARLLWPDSFGSATAQIRHVRRTIPGGTAYHNEDPH